MAFKKVVVINCQGHLLGRLASTVAKEILNGQHVVCVKCENINISGSLHRNKLKYQAFLRLRMNSNPRRGPYHMRAPSRIFWRAVRGMIRHKTIRGKKALSRLEALRVMRLRPGRDFCRLGELSEMVGWSKGSLISRLEEKRKARSLKHFQRKKAEAKEKAAAMKEVTKSMPKESVSLLQQCGYA
ncbi:60S ribosomal protein L13a, putative [Eimeria mitis]|uniref:60S ribosomal protein L13a, putative n=1 Tax=Eimeria mitis TaxID=44415 RepID=U6KDF9_9EIME|nr:60S ribosomal protein L13a, putative [Eimeria mitis]CDJ33508.1 60S ribosomal protein L13a, putative [Eimeria mitis]